MGFNPPTPPPVVMPSPPPAVAPLSPTDPQSMKPPKKPSQPTFVAQALTPDVSGRSLIGGAPSQLGA